MAYFEMTSNFKLRDELQLVRKNDAYKLQDIARAIKNGQDTKDIEFRANGKVVSKDQYADEVLRVIAEYQEKYDRTHKTIWIQQGVCHNSGYHKSIKIA